MQKTEAMKIIEARRGSYAQDGYADETELLLLSQHHGELKARQEKEKQPHKRRPHP